MFKRRSKNKKSAIFLSWLILSLLIICYPVSAFPEEREWLNQTVSLKFYEEPRKRILEKFCNQAGISILYDTALAAEKITGDFHDIKVIEAINRIFPGKNNSLIISEINKTIVIKHFNAKQYQYASNDEDRNDELSLPDGMMVTELHKLHTQQYKEYKKQVASGEEMLEDGMSVKELHTLHAKQYNDYLERSTSEERILEGGMTLGELRAVHKKQIKDYKTWSTRENKTIEGDMTLGELRSMHKKQYQEMQKEGSGKAE